MKVIRRNYGQGAGKAEQKVRDDDLLLDRLIYKRMGSLTDAKALTTPPEKDSEYHRWLLEMNDLHNSKYYPSLYAGPIPTPDIVALDSYLGTLGDTEEYPFQQDTYSVEAWLEIEAQDEYRVLIEDTGTEEFTLMDGANTLVLYT